jgi:hypothetical protein
MSKKIVIVLEGGVVQNVLTDEPTEVTVVDYDTEGAEENEITKVLGNDAVVAVWDAEVNPEEIERI